MASIVEILTGWENAADFGVEPDLMPAVTALRDVLGVVAGMVMYAADAKPCAPVVADFATSITEAIADALDADEEL